MFALVVAHMCAALVAPWLVDRMGRRALRVLAVLPAACVILALALAPRVIAGTAPEESLVWIPGLDVTLWMRMDLLSWLMTLIVGGVGLLVLVYASSYFTDTSSGLRRFAATFTAFAGAMFGVAVSDDVIGLYTFWEATAVLSFLLIGHHYERRPARTGARQALLLTSSGALALFVGFVVLTTTPGGTPRISGLVHAAATGELDTSSPQVILGAALVVIGALSKSALLPFHFWLPGAMTAPTPVSAYLHAAAMVKAGVYLVARLTPGFTDVPGFSPIIVTVGLVTMLIGATRALRQHDLKLVLAYGTVSQLGLITATIAIGSASAMASGLVMLLSHSLFKSSLFLTVGAVEQSTGSRDLRKLTGVGRQKPVLAAGAALAAASMAGLPVTSGYLGKEALLSALIDGSGAAWIGGGHNGTTPTDLLIGLVVLTGSTLTAAYAWRFWWGAFGRRHLKATEESDEKGDITRPDSRIQGELTACAPTPFPMLLVIWVLASGALLGLLPTYLEHVIGLHGAGQLPGHAHLAWWSGWLPALLTALIFLAAALLAAHATWVEDIQRKVGLRVTLADLYAWSIHEIEIGAARLTRFVQRGSLPWDLSIILLTLCGGAAAVLLMDPPSRLVLHWADSPPQVLLVLLISIAAFFTVRSRRRMRAALLLGAVGLGVCLLWVVQGAPDLAITQLVVEAVGFVVFVLVLRRLPPLFSDRPLQRSRWWRLFMAVVSALGTVCAGLYASSARIHTPVSALMANEAWSFGHGKNIVNVILVDIRAWDTVGELSVLLVIATGVASLVHITGRRQTPTRQRQRGTVLAAATQKASLGEERTWTSVTSVVTRFLFPTMIVISVWLLLVGHNAPGGGFVGGVVAGLAFVLRYIEGGRAALADAMPAPAGQILGTGLFIAGLGALLPLVNGNTVLESTAIDWHFGGYGDIHFTTAMILDVGVYVLVIGVVLDLISTLGSELDLQGAREERA